MSLSGKDVAEIARLLDQSRFARLELEIGDFRLRINREGARVSSRRPETPVAARPTKATERPQATAVGTLRKGEVDVPAPLLGTFYHAPRPGDPPFVAVGQDVSEETVIGIIEVMKLMNAVHAGVSGKVVAVLADNAQAVEAGQPLIRVATR